MTTRDLILEYIKEYFLEHCYPPTYDEIADEIGICKSGVFGHMQRLFLEGKLESDFKDGFAKKRAFRPKGFKCIDTNEARHTDSTMRRIAEGKGLEPIGDKSESPGITWETRN